MSDDDEWKSSAFSDVLIALIAFFEENGEQSIPIKTLKALLMHYNIIN